MTKSVKAWAVADNKEDPLRNCKIFPTRADAECFVITGERIIRVEIREIPKKKRRKS